MHNQAVLVPGHRHQAMAQAPCCVLQGSFAYTHALQASGSQYAAEEPSDPLTASHKLDSIAHVWFPVHLPYISRHEKSRDFQ